MNTNDDIMLLADRPCWIACGADSVLAVTRGIVWLTCEGRIDDVFLRAGQTLRPGAGRVLVEGVGAAVLQHRREPAARGDVVSAWRRATSAVSPRL